MTLRQKTHAAIVLTIVALIIGLDITARKFVLGGFREVETQNTKTNVQRVLAAVAEELSNLESDVGDWAPWDDAYEFIENGNEEFIAANCPPATFENLDISAMVFIHISGRIIYEQGYDAANKRFTSVPTGLLDCIAANDTISKHDSTISSIKGIVILPEGPMLIVSQPIVTSDFSGPIRGTLVMGRFLDENLLEKIAKRTHVQLNLLPFKHEDCSPNCDKQRELLSNGISAVTYPIDTYTISGYGLLRDLFGEPAYIIKTQQPRTIYGHGRASLHYFLVLLIIMGIICWAVIAILLDRQVVRRIATLAEQVRIVGINKDLSARIPTKGSDEITRLATAVNSMLGEIEKFALALEVSNTSLQQEIKEHELANEALRFSESKYRTYIENAPIGVFVVDSQSVFIEANDVGCALIGYPIIELRKQSLCEIIHAESSRCVEDHLSKLTTTGCCSGEFEAHNGNGERLVLSINAVRVAEDRFLVFIVNVTEQKRADEVTKRLQKAVESSGEVIFMTDPQGTFTYINPEFTRLYGYQAEEIVGICTPRILKADDTDPSVYKELWDQLLAGHVVRQEMRNVTKDRRVVEMSVSVNPVVNGEGAIEGFLAVQRDITDLKRNEELRQSMASQLRQAQKMETIGTLAGGIAHDFNNILTPIIAYSGLAAEQLDIDHPVREDLNRIVASANRAKDLVKQILTFSRQMEQERFPVELSPIVKESLKLMRASIPTTIEIVQDIDNNCGDVVADPSQIHQVILNLCTNAFHAMRENGGRLSVTMKPFSVDEAMSQTLHDLLPGEYIRLTVADTGCGMSQPTLQRIFEPFFTTKQVGEGTGLGLSVVHGIVKSHDGVITVASELGVGTTFDLYLPRTRSEKVKQITDKTPIVGGHERILIVDDELEVAETIRRVLEMFGYSITIRTSSVEAFELFKQDPKRFDILITDQTMPQMTGDQLARQVMQLRMDLPIILMTGFSETMDEDRAKQLGIDCFLMKPLLPSDVARAVRNVLDGSDML
ncbi:MAG: CHASE4 domain-containing protein [Calditrichota bacterium]